MSRNGLVAPSFVFAFAFAVPAHASQGTASEPINPIESVTSVIGGTAVPPGKWPDAVAVLGQGSCTGTLIAPDVVLTAGHCMDMNPTQVKINSTDYAAAGGITAQVKTAVAYPNWENSYDVGVIVLTAPVAGITPRKLGTSCTFTQDFGDNKMVHLVGFGLTDTAGQGNNTRLNETMAPVTDADCSGPGGCVPSISPGGEFIAGGGGNDSCFGDSGGPVYLDTPRGTVVVGAVSRGLDGAATPCGGGGVYVRTDKIVQWIEQTAGKPVEKDTCATEPGGDPGEDPGEPDDNGPAGPDRPSGSAGGGDLSGGCSSSSGSASALFGLLAGALLRRRKRS